MEEQPYKKLHKSIYGALLNAIRASGYDVDESALRDSIEPSRNFGDVSTSIAQRIASAKGASAKEVAERIIAALKKPDAVESAEAANGFINFSLDRSKYCSSSIAQLLSSGSIFASEAGASKKAIIEYPSINPAHPMHMGQVRNVLLGEAIANLMGRAGYAVEREDYIDDLGLQVAQVVWGLTHMERLGMKFDPSKKFDHMIGEIYVAVNRMLKDDVSISEEVNNLLLAIEQRGTYESKMAREMAENFVLAEYSTIISMGIYHDVLVWESDIVHEKLLESALKILEEKGITSKPADGKYANCIVIDHSKIAGIPDEFKGMKEGTKVLVRSNGAPNYLAKDIAFHMWKLGLIPDTFKYHKFMDQGAIKKPLYSTGESGVPMEFGRASRAVNTIDARQSYEQAMVKLAIRLVGGASYEESIKHVAYGVVELEDAALSGRKGTWVGYTCDDLLREAKEKAMKLITERFKLGDEEKEGIASDIGMSAIKYEFLKLSNDKTLTFSWQRALNFEGNSGPYCEYMYARSARLLEDAAAKGFSTGAMPEGYSVSDAEFMLVKHITYAQEMLEKAAREYKPNIIVEYVSKLATLFSKFYEEVPVLKAPDEARGFRLSIVKAFNMLMKEALLALGINPVARM